MKRRKGNAMSSDLDVPLQEPLDTGQVHAQTTLVLREMLRRPDAVPLCARLMEQGVITFHPPPQLGEEDGTLLLNLDELEGYKSCIGIFLFRPEELVASISMTGGGGVTYPRFVLAAAAAIAIAQLVGSHIEDGGLVWSREFESTPEELLERLRCKQPHASIEEAMQEVLANMKR